jgi:hypothetical protein
MTYVGFSTTNKLVSRIIRWVTRAKVSHTFLLVEMFERDWVIGAEFQGLIMLPLEKFQKNNTIKAIYGVPELTDSHLAVVMENLGDSYDFGGLIGGIFPQIGKWFKQKWNNPFAKKKALICSEFVTLALQECKLDGAENLDPTAISPQELEDFLIKHNFTKG